MCRRGANGETHHKKGNAVLSGFKMVGIYIITNLVNGKRYIGQSVDIKKRFYAHRCISHETNVHLKRALAKYGKENFKYEILEECSIEELDEKEIYYIKTLKPEYNVSLGGQYGMKKYPESVRAVISKKAKEQWERKTDEEKAYIIQHNLNSHVWNKGKHLSGETKEKLRQANLGKKQSKKTIEKRKQTIIRLKQNGYVQTNSSHKKKVICIETGQIFDSVKETGEYFSVHPSAISAVLTGKYKTCKGYHFKYQKCRD